MTDFRISSSQPHGADEANPLAIFMGSSALTRLIRREASSPVDYLNVPPAQLAFWLVDNWWRLQWECWPAAGPSLEWRQAHELASIGGGCAWPRASFWGDGERIGIIAREDPPGPNRSIRFLTNALGFISIQVFETEISRFLTSVDSAQWHDSTQKASFAEILSALDEERRNPEVSAWRRLEAALSFDPDEAPADLMEGFSDLINEFGQADIEEAASAAPSLNSLRLLKKNIAAAQSSSSWKCDFSELISQVSPLQRAIGKSPWEAAERAAQEIRESFGIRREPLLNKKLGELLNLNPRAFAGTKGQASDRNDLDYGLSLKAGQGHRIAFRSRWDTGRRFEAARALGDAFWSKNSKLGIIAGSKTARQKFSRAFAGSLLCPYEGLLQYMGTSSPDEDDVNAAAKHFHVSSWTVQTILVNKQEITREEFDRKIREANDTNNALDSLIEAA